MSRLLPHQGDRPYPTDGGIETWLMYKQGFERPHFCTFHFLADPRGRDELRHVNVYGGCCGTDSAHVAGICDAVQRVRGLVTA